MTCTKFYKHLESLVEKCIKKFTSKNRYKFYDQLNKLISRALLESLPLQSKINIISVSLCSYINIRCAFPGEHGLQSIVPIKLFYLRCFDLFITNPTDMDNTPYLLASKNLFTSVIQSCLSKVRQAGLRLDVFYLVSLERISRDPWGNPTLGALMRDKEVDHGEVLEFLTVTEQPESLRSRIKFLVEHNCLDLAFNLLRWAVRHHVMSKDVSAITLLLHLTCHFGFNDPLGAESERTRVVGSTSVLHGLGPDAFHVDPTSGCLFDRFGQMIASSDFSNHLDSIVGEVVNETSTSLHKRSIDDVDSFVDSQTKRRRVQCDSESSWCIRNNSLPPRIACTKSRDQIFHGNKNSSSESEGIIGISSSQPGLQKLEELFESTTHSCLGSRDLSDCDHLETADQNKNKAKCYFEDLFYELCSKIPLQIVVQIFHMTGYGFLEFQEMFQKYHPIVLRTLLLIVWRKGEISDISRLEMLIGKWLEVEKNWGKREKLFKFASPEQVASLSSCAKHKTVPTSLAISEPHVNEIFGNRFQKETNKVRDSTIICEGDGSSYPDLQRTDNHDEIKECSGSSWMVAMMKELVGDSANVWQTIMLVKKILSECGGQHLRLCSLILLDLLKKERFRHYVVNTLPGRSKAEEDEASENLSTICKVLVDISRLAGRNDVALSCFLSSAFLQPSNMSFDSIRNLFIKSESTRELEEDKSRDKMDRGGAKGHLTFLKIEPSDDSSFVMQKDGHLEVTKDMEMEEIFEEVKKAVERLRDSGWRSEGSWGDLEHLMAQHYKQCGWVWDFKRNCFRKIRHRKARDELILSQKFTGIKRRRGRPRLHPSTCDESDCSITTVTADECSNDRSDNYNSQDSHWKAFPTTRKRKYRKRLNKFNLAPVECIRSDRAPPTVVKLEQESLKAERGKYTRKKQRVGALFPPADKQKSSQSSNFLAVRKQKLKEKLLRMRLEKERAKAVKSKCNPKETLADDLRPCVAATIGNSASCSSVPELTKIEEFGDGERALTSSSGEPPTIADERIDGIRFEEIERTSNNKDLTLMVKDYLVTEFKNIDRIEENFKLAQLEADDVESGDNDRVFVKEMCEDKMGNNDLPVSVRDEDVRLRDESPILRCDVLFEIPEQAEEIPITASVGPKEKADLVARMSETLATDMYFAIHSDGLPNADWQTIEENSLSATNCMDDSCHLGLKETNIHAIEKASASMDVLTYDALDSHIIPDEGGSKQMPDSIKFGAATIASKSQKDYLTLIRGVIDSELSVCDVEQTGERSQNGVVTPVDELRTSGNADQLIKSDASPEKSPENISEDSRSLVSTIGDSSDCLVDDSSACILYKRRYEEIVGCFSSKKVKEKERTELSQLIVREDIKLNGVAKVALPRLDLARVMKRRRLRVLVERFDGRPQIQNIESRSNNHNRHFSMTLKPSISFVQLSSSCDPSVTSLSSSLPMFEPPSGHVPPLHSEPSPPRSMISLESSSLSSAVAIRQQSLPLVSSLSALSLNSATLSESPASPSLSSPSRLSTFTLSTSLSPLTSLLATSGAMASLPQQLVPSRSLLFSTPTSNAIFLSVADDATPLSLSPATAATPRSPPSSAQLSPVASPATFLSKPSFIPVLAALSFPLPLPSPFSPSSTSSHSTLTETKSLKVTWLSQRPRMSISPSASDKSPNASIPLQLPTSLTFSPTNSEQAIDAPKLSRNADSDPLAHSALCSSASLLSSLPFSSLAFAASSQLDKNMGVIKISSFSSDKSEKLDAIFDFKNATVVSIPNTGAGSCCGFGDLFLSAGESIGLLSNPAHNEIYSTNQDIELNTDYCESDVAPTPTPISSTTMTLVDVVCSSASIVPTCTTGSVVGITNHSSCESSNDKVIPISTTSTVDESRNSQEVESSLKLVSKQHDEETYSGDLSKEICEAIHVSTLLSNTVASHSASTATVHATGKAVESIDLLLPLASKAIEIPLLFEHPPSPCSLNSWMNSSGSAAPVQSFSSSISKCRANTIRSRFRSLNVASDLSCLSCQHPIKDFSQLDRHLVVEHPGL